MDFSKTVLLYWKAFSALLCLSSVLVSNGLLLFCFFLIVCFSFLLVFFLFFFNLIAFSFPAVFGFLLSDKCGFSAERLVLNKRRDAVESVAGAAFLLAAERVQTGSYISLDYIIGDTGISQGRYVQRWSWPHLGHMVLFICFSYLSPKCFSFGALDRMEPICYGEIHKIFMYLCYFAGTIGRLRWSRTPTWLRWEWLQIQRSLNGSTIQETPAAQGMSSTNMLSSIVGFRQYLFFLLFPNKAWCENTHYFCVWLVLKPVM